MPVLLQSEDGERWLTADLTKEEIDSLLAPHDASQMQAYPVPRLAAATGGSSNVPEAVKPATYPKLPPVGMS